MSRCTLLFIKYIKKKGLLNSTGNSVQHSVINYTQKQSLKKEWIYVYV